MILKLILVYSRTIYKTVAVVATTAEAAAVAMVATIIEAAAVTMAAATAEGINLVESRSC